MNTLLLAIAGILSWFVVLLVARSITPWRPCALCGSVVATWVLLLILRWASYSVDPVVVALLIGATAHGLLTKFDQHSPHSWHVFRLPVFLTLTLVGYSVVEGVKNLGSPSILTLLAWVVFAIAFVYHHTPSLRHLTDRLLACCRNW